jgi:hypothetical protein
MLGSSFTCKCKTRVEEADSDQHSSLLRYRIHNYVCKFFIVTAADKANFQRIFFYHGACVIKHFPVLLLGMLYQGGLTEEEGSVQLTSLSQLVQISCFLKVKLYFSIITKQPILMRRSTVLSLPLQ